MAPDRDSLANGLVTIGEEAVAKATTHCSTSTSPTTTSSTAQPASSIAKGSGPTSPRCARAFTDFTISRAQILVDGNFVSARTVMAGRFDKEFAYTPIGTVEPYGQQVQWELINIFRYTDEGRLVEEWVQTDAYDFLRQLGAVGS
jgi:hypothetical protein